MKKCTSTVVLICVAMKLNEIKIPTIIGFRIVIRLFLYSASDISSELFNQLNKNILSQKSIPKYCK